MTVDNRETIEKAKEIRETIARQNIQIGKAKEKMQSFSEALPYVTGRMKPLQDSTAMISQSIGIMRSNQPGNESEPPQQITKQQPLKRKAIF